MLNPGVLSGTRAWPLQGFGLDYDFVNDRYWHNGSQPHGITTTRSGTANIEDSTGTFSVVNANTLRRSDLGAKCDTTRKNSCLWSRDLTTASWIALNVTTAKNQTGIDGVANSASSLTATSANGSLLQSITLALSARVQSAFVRRLVGTGTVSMTMDGLTWVVVPVTSAWTRVKIPTQTLLNPMVGFQLAISGDSIAIDCVQNENNNTGDFFTSPIFTTTVGVTRNVDLNALTIGAAYADIFKQPQLTVVVDFAPVHCDVVDGNFFQIDDGTQSNSYVLNYLSNGLSGTTINKAGSGLGYDPIGINVDTPTKLYRYVTSIDTVANKVGSALNGFDTESTNTAWPDQTTFTNVRFGAQAAGGPLSGFVRRTAASPFWMPKAQRLALSRARLS